MKARLRARFMTMAGLGFAALSAFSSLASAQTFHYHGRLLDPDGIPVNAPNVQFKIEIRSPGIEDCLLYSETHTKNLTGADGYFSLSLNDLVSPPSVPNSEPFSLADVFQKQAFTLGMGKCAIGTSYVPLSGEGRRWVLSFNDGTGWDQFPSEMIDRVPLAISAMAVGEFKSSNLLRVVDAAGAPANASPLTEAMFTELSAILNGTTTQYVRSPSGGGATLPSYSSAPTAPSPGQIWYDSSTQDVKLRTSSGTITLGSGGGGSGTVTQITAAGGLEGGTITTTGTIKLATSGVTAGSYAKVTVDSFGRVTTGHSLVSTDIPGLAASHITAGILPITRGGTGVSATPLNGQLLIGNGTDYTLSTLTAGTGVSITNAAGSITINAAGGGGTVTSVNAGSGLTGGPITGAGTLSLAVTGISAGTYAKVSVDTFGRAIAGSALSASDIPSLDASKIVSGTFASARLPSNVVYDSGNVDIAGSFMAGNDATCSSGKYGAIRVNANSLQVCLASNTWSTLSTGGATGTVTSLTAGAGLDGGTITTTGTFALATTGVAAGVYAKVTVDSYGRAIAGSTLSSTDIPSLDAAKLTSGTLAAARIPDLDASKITTGTLAAARLPSNVVLDGGNVTSGTLVIGTQTLQPVSLRMNGQERLQVATDGDVYLKGNSLNISNDSNNYPQVNITTTSNTGNTQWVANRARGTVSAPLKALQGDTTNQIIARAHNGSSYFNTAEITFKVDNENAGGTDRPGGKIMFASRGSLDTSPFVINQTNMVIQNDGRVGIGTTSPATRLSVNGAILAGDETTCDSTKYGAIRVNANNLQVCLATNAWSNIAASGATGTVTSIVAGTGLSGGTISTTGTIALATTGVASGTYTKITIDTYGRASAGSTLSATDIPNLDASKITTGSLAIARLPSSIVLDGGNSMTSGTLRIGTTSNHPLSLLTNGTSALDVTASGYVGIGTTTPTQMLQVAGSAVFDGNVQFASGSATAPSLTFAGNTNTGFYRVTTNQIGVSLGGLKRFEFNPTGLEGIGNGSPYLRSIGGNASLPTYSFNTDPDTGMYSAAADEVAISTGGTERVRIGSLGNIGIGTTTPATKLQVTGAILAGDDSTCADGKYGALRVNSNSLQVCLASNTWTTLSTGGATGTVTSIVAGAGLTGGTITTTGTIALSTTGVNAGSYAKVLVDSYGRVTSGMFLSDSDIPSHDASKITSGTFAVARIPDLDASKITGGTINNLRLPSNVLLDGGNSISSGTLVIGSTGSFPMSLMTNNTPAIFIAADGKIGIGTTSPTAPFQVKSTANALGSFERTNTSLGSQNNILELISTTSGGTTPAVNYEARLLYRLQGNGSIRPAGSVGIGWERSPNSLSEEDTFFSANVYKGGSSYNALRASSSRNLGIDVSNRDPSAKLQVHNFTSASPSNVLITNEDNGYLATDGLLIGLNGVNAYITNQESGTLSLSSIGDMIFRTNGATRVTVATNGSVKVQGALVSGAQSAVSGTAGVMGVDFSGANTFRATLSGSCSSLNITGVEAGGQYILTMPNITSTCSTITLNGSAAAVKIPSGQSGGVPVDGLVYTFAYDGTQLWLTEVLY